MKLGEKCINKISRIIKNKFVKLSKNFTSLRLRKKLAGNSRETFLWYQICCVILRPDSLFYLPVTFDRILRMMPKTIWLSLYQNTATTFVFAFFVHPRRRIRMERWRYSDEIRGRLWSFCDSTKCLVGLAHNQPLIFDQCGRKSIPCCPSIGIPHVSQKLLECLNHSTDFSRVCGNPRSSHCWRRQNCQIIKSGTKN